MSVILILIGILALVFFYNLFKFRKVKRSVTNIKRLMPVADCEYQRILADVIFDIMPEPP